MYHKIYIENTNEPMNQPNEYPTLEAIQATDWYKSRPECIRQAIDQVPPTCNYILKSSGRECFITAYTEPKDANSGVTLIVQMTGKGGPLSALGLAMLDNFSVFGLSLDDIKPVDNGSTNN